MVREREVVDGHQRLITMFLIAYALRNLAKEKGENDIAEAITSSYLENNTSDTKYKYRLQPSVSDDDAQQIFESINSTENYRYIDDYHQTLRHVSKVPYRAGICNCPNKYEERCQNSECQKSAFAYIPV